jgi:hypothetical protein
LCRWLLLSLDRLQGDELVMTQELIASDQSRQESTFGCPKLRLES